MPHLYRNRDKNGKPHGKWRFQYTDWRGIRKTGTGSWSKAETEKLARRVESENDEIRRGYREPPSQARKYLKRPFRQLADEYLAWGESQGGRGGRPWAKVHARMRRSYMDWWEERLKLKTMADLRGVLPRVESELRALKKKKKLAGKSLQNYAETLGSFCKWCVRRGYLKEDPLALLKPFDTTPRVHRRAMTQEEIWALFEAAPTHRQLLYAVAFCSGLRAGELRALTVDDLDVANSGLRLHAEWTKNRKAGFQPLPRSLVERLVEFAETGEAVIRYRNRHLRRDRTADFPENPLLYVTSHPARELGIDLKEAGIPKETKEGKIDFHSCRVAFVTFALEAGANVKEAQTLARHATPDLTMNVYGRTRDARLSQVAERVGERILNGPSIKYAESGRGRNLTPLLPSSYMVEAAGIEAGEGVFS